MSLYIWSPPGGGRAAKALVAAQYVGVKVETGPQDFKMGTTNKSAEFLAKFPLGKVPAMDTPFGPLVESGAIARYIARLNPSAGLLGSSFYEGALVDQWIDWNCLEFETTRANWLYTVVGYREPYDPKVAAEGKANTFKALQFLDGHLASRTFVVNERVTLADITIATGLVWLFKEFIPKDAASKQFPNVVRFFETCINQKEFKAVIPEFAWATSEKQYSGPATPPAATETKAAPSPVSPTSPTSPAKQGTPASPAGKKEEGKKPETPKSGKKKKGR